nr:immunoglobulin light chain junction region [Macaca mulatta]MOW59033.1 immunoglobulin light chain junction region [Macaca mulatta]
DYHCSSYGGSETLLF